MTVRIDNYRSLYVAESLNGYVIVYKNTFKGITAPFTKEMCMAMFGKSVEYHHQSRANAKDAPTESNDEKKECGLVKSNDEGAVITKEQYKKARAKRVTKKKEVQEKVQE